MLLLWTSGTAQQACLASLQVQSQLEEQREWHAAAQQLAALTSGTAPTPTCMSTGGSTPVSSSPRVGSPTKRAPLAARSRNSSSSHLAPSSRRAPDDENSPAVPSPLGPGYQAAPPSIVVAAAAAASALAAKADTPRAWLELMQARFAALKEQAAVAEQAAAEADVALDAVRRESSTNQQKVLLPFGEARASEGCLIWQTLALCMQYNGWAFLAAGVVPIYLFGLCSCQKVGSSASLPGHSYM